MVKLQKASCKSQPSSWLDSLEIDLIVDAPSTTSTDSSSLPYHPQAAFIKSVLPVDRRICLAKHDNFCGNQKRQLSRIDNNDNTPRKLKIKLSTMLHRNVNNAQEDQDTNPKNSDENSDDIRPSLKRQCIEVDDGGTTLCPEIIATKDDPMMDSTETIDDIITSLISNTATAENLSSITKLSIHRSSGYLTVYQKFLNFYENTYNQHDPNLAFGFLQSTCFSKELTRLQFMWDRQPSPPILSPSPNLIINDIPIYLTRRIEVKGINNLYSAMVRMFSKLPDCIAIVQDITSQYYPDKQITIVKASYEYFFTVVLNSIFPNRMITHASSLETANIAMNGYDLFIFNDEGRIIKIMDHMIIAHSTYPTITLDDIMNYLGF